MTQAFKDEFALIDAILAGDTQTAGVDALALSILRSERQMRRLMTNAAFQSRALDSSMVSELKAALVERSELNFEQLRVGFQQLSGMELFALFGDRAEAVTADLRQVTIYRNKIFHGQLTGHQLERPELEALVETVKEWCRVIATEANATNAYDGFARNSFRKTGPAALVERVSALIPSVASYRQFLKALVPPRRSSRPSTKPTPAL